MWPGPQGAHIKAQLRPIVISHGAAPREIMRFQRRPSLESQATGAGRSARRSYDRLGEGHRRMQTMALIMKATPTFQKVSPHIDPVKQADTRKAATPTRNTMI